MWKSTMFGDEGTEDVLLTARRTTRKSMWFEVVW